ncbi:uncharacterized protein LOC117488075 isoform X2 [Trematomus bernacchii]|uniref:uncharacterized protein LOC117488075 isoform X2 n=1 Tax=Trematomus bernacchii TaxID=40690 RepID=UPI00146DB534|nr:uncharacterized protein LOC117488075 isoform X2 [Trematomus bernacchii]
MDFIRYGQQKVSSMLYPPAIKYHGLVNQGSTCYLNSVLQVLFMTKDFREAVERHISDNPDSEHIDLQLESLFGDLKSYPAYTYKITKKLGINKVYEQQDAAEYFEKILAKTSDDASKIFHGQLTHKTTCSSCGTEIDAAGPFWNLTLALEDSYSQNFSVVNGIEKYFRESSLNGENQMYCEKCDDKSDATTKCVINHHPEVLMLLLKRFEFDYYSMRYVKINCTVDVPCTLQIPENQPYELYAVVEHSGDLSSGHYIATIKSEDDGRCYSFNDSCVTELHSQPFQLDTFQNSTSAYLLFYRKEKAIKYHGLENQGSTCNLNSVLQVLFMTKDFREAVERLPSENTEHIDLHLQSLFGVLKSRTAKTKDITKKLRIQEVCKQQDAAEYYEKILRLTSDDASKIFHGQLTHMTRCSSCGTRTDADESFWHLPLALEDSSSQNYRVEKGIEEYFRESSLNGENQMYCEKCDDKSDATTKCVIKHHPEVLTLLLKRFEFDHYYNRYVKINCTVDVPCTLQIPENQPYELYAMVEHSGDLSSGHHSATIKSEHDGRWYSFNDRCVTLLDSQPFQSDKVEKSSSAYLLFYRKAIKYHGLENQGSTCYLNSVLQVLFMTKDFREAVERLPSENTEHIDLQLQSLFGVLKRRTAKTKDITKKLGIKDVSKQQDAAEYYEKILRLTSDDASKIFHGQLTHMTTCLSCDTKTDADKAFWHLPLALEDSSSQNFSVEKGIEEFFRASHLNGGNQMYCDLCRAKSDATTKCVIKHHPEVLTLLLKRFEFDYSKRYVKINCTVDVPCTLQIPENQTYELYAMVEHSGDLRSGHHIATIKSEHDGRWYSFNDSWVTLLHSQPFQSDKVQKSSSASLLFYRKEKVSAAGTQDFREESTPGGSPLSTWETQDQSPAERREREEDEGTAEESKDPAATAFIYRDEGTGFKDKDTARPSAGETAQYTMVDGEHFVDKHRTELINRVCCVADILDKLLEEKVMIQSSYDKIMAIRTNQQKMRKLFNGPLNAAGPCGKEVFYRILEEKEKFLIDELKGKK